MERRGELESYVVFFPHAPVHLHGMFTGCGCETRRDASYFLNGLDRGYESAIWQYTLEGEGALEFEGVVHRLKPGDAMCVTTPHDHKYYLPPESPKWKHLYLSFNGSELIRLWREMIGKYGPVIPLSGALSPTLELANEMLTLTRAKKLRSAYHASELVYSFVMTFLEETTENNIAAEAKFVFDAIQFCRKHYSEDISVGDIADAAGYSRCHFTRQFKKIHGESPAKYLRDLRFGHAARMLRQSRLSVKEIAVSCGFPDESHFCRIFREHYGVTPDGYRKGRN